MWIIQKYLLRIFLCIYSIICIPQYYSDMIPLYIFISLYMYICFMYIVLYVYLYLLYTCLYVFSISLIYYYTLYDIYLFIMVLYQFIRVLYQYINILYQFICGYVFDMQVQFILYLFLYGYIFSILFYISLFRQ